MRYRWSCLLMANVVLITFLVEIIAPHSIQAIQATTAAPLDTSMPPIIPSPTVSPIMTGTPLLTPIPSRSVLTVTTTSVSPLVITETPTLAPSVTAPRSSEVILVTSLLDTTDGPCCTLRQALMRASDGATINFMAGLTGTIVLTDVRHSRPLVLDKSVTINGPGPKSLSLVIDAQWASPIFILERPLAVTLNNLTLAKGHVITDRGSGGAIVNERGTLNLVNITLRDNEGRIGGAIYNEGTLNVLNSTFHGNRAHSGGAIHNSEMLTIINSSFQDNDATIGSALYNEHTAIILNSTFAVSAGKASVPVIAGSQAVTLKNSIFVDLVHQPGPPPCTAPITDGGGNLQFPEGLCGRLPSGDPKLGPLQDNGGPTWTLALLPGSAALNRIFDDSCPPADQRGLARLPHAACDIGAFQHDALLPSGTPFAWWMPQPVVTATLYPTTTPTPTYTPTVQFTTPTPVLVGTPMVSPTPPS